MDLKEKVRRCRDFLDALDEERRKILVFQRELPLCLNLINQTIESYKRMVDVVATNDEDPVLQEFISVKPSSLISEENIIHDQENKKDWMANISTQEPDVVHEPDLPRQKPIAVETKESWDDVDDNIHNINKEKEIAANSSPEVISTSMADDNEGSDGEEEEKLGHLRKARRYWSEELHRRFLDAVHQLGGCYVATPKQIRELMKVEGLTNDEVKSHLQKFRIQSRRTSLVMQSQSPQFMVGIWIPPPEYTMLTATATTAATGTHTWDVCHASNISTTGTYGFIFQDQRNQL